MRVRCFSASCLMCEPPSSFYILLKCSEKFVIPFIKCIIAQCSRNACIIMKAKALTNHNFGFAEKWVFLCFWGHRGWLCFSYSLTWREAIHVNRWLSALQYWRQGRLAVCTVYLALYCDIWTSHVLRPQLVKSILSSSRMESFRIFKNKNEKERTKERMKKVRTMNSCQSWRTISTDKLAVDILTLQANLQACRQIHHIFPRHLSGAREEPRDRPITLWHVLFAGASFSLLLALHAYLTSSQFPHVCEAPHPRPSWHFLVHQLLLYCTRMIYITLRKYMCWEYVCRHSMGMSFHAHGRCRGTRMWNQLGHPRRKNDCHVEQEHIVEYLAPACC